MVKLPVKPAALSGRLCRYRPLGSEPGTTQISLQHLLAPAVGIPLAADSAVGRTLPDPAKSKLCRSST